MTLNLQVNSKFLRLCIRAGAMFLSCVSLSGRELLQFADVQPNTLVSELQLRISSAVQVPVLRQQLAYRGEQLDGKCTLAAASVKDGARARPRRPRRGRAEGPIGASELGPWRYHEGYQSPDHGER